MNYLLNIRNDFTLRSSPLMSDSMLEKTPEEFLIQFYPVRTYIEFSRNHLIVILKMSLHKLIFILYLTWNILFIFLQAHTEIIIIKFFINKNRN